MLSMIKGFLDVAACLKHVVFAWIWGFGTCAMFAYGMLVGFAIALSGCILWLIGSICKHWLDGDYSTRTALFGDLALLGVYVGLFSACFLAERAGIDWM